jgi:hypothetical protein
LAIPIRRAAAPQRTLVFMLPGVGAVFVFSYYLQFLRETCVHKQGINNIQKKDGNADLRKYVDDPGQSPDLRIGGYPRITRNLICSLEADTTDLEHQ